MKVKQVPAHQYFPSGEARYIAVLRQTPEQLADKYSIVFEEGVDDLDRYQLAALDGGSSGQMWLFRHFSSPESGTEVLVDSKVNPEDALATLLRSLQLDEDSLVWVYKG